MFATEDLAPISLDFRPDWRSSLGPVPLELEIGPGHGGFALAFARAHPERALVAVEQREKFARQLQAKVAGRNLPRLLVLHGDARLVAARLFAPGELAAVHLHFPDPWWKRKHHERRILDDGLALLIRRLLAPGGLLDFRTDVERYANEALEVLEEAGFANAAGRGKFSEMPPGEIPSTREKRYLETGQPVWRLQMRR